ncbi:N-acetylmuramoyl-L-alanine amidase [bacterium]|nr:N-acetylmuramoyl-L-alanine amidase [bacterium]
MRYIFSFIIFFLVFIKSSSVFSDPKFIYEQALCNIKKEYDYLKHNYTADIIAELDKTNYSNKKYSTRIKLIYKGLIEAENILYKKITNIDAELLKGTEIKGVVFLDPGHGGDDTGATVPPCLNDRDKILFAESDITFAISQIVKKNLAEKGYFAVLSRDSVEDGPSLYARSALCRAINPDLSVSVHLNSSQFAYPIFDMPETAMPEINYTRVYVWAPRVQDLLIPFYMDIYKKINLAGSREKTLELAELMSLSLKKYLGIDFYMPDEKLANLANLKLLRKKLQNKNIIVSAKRQYAKVSESIVPVEVSSLNRRISKKYFEQVRNISGVDGKDLHMVREMPQTPSILVESIFISNPDEQNLLRNSDRINQIANAIEYAIIEYFTNLPKTKNK